MDSFLGLTPLTVVGTLCALAMVVLLRFASPRAGAVLSVALGWWLACLLLVAFAPPALAFGQVGAQQTTVWTCSGDNGTKTGGSPSAACSAAHVHSECNTSTGYCVSVTAGSCNPIIDNSHTVGCYFRRVVRINGNIIQDSQDYLNASPSVDWTCGDGANTYGSGAQTVCGCAEGYKPDAQGQCKPYSCPTPGSYSAVTQPDQLVAGGDVGKPSCMSGCTAMPSSWKTASDGKIWATWPFKYTGKACGGEPLKTDNRLQSGEERSQNPAPIPCGANQCPGQVNGANICVACTKQEEQGPSSSASSPSNGASGPDAGTTTSTTTQCDGINCTTTTTVRDLNGNVVSQVDKTDKQQSFCHDNPTSALCKGSAFGGSCAATTCDGDAVQCALAQETFKRNCQWFDDPAAASLKDVGEAAMNGQAQPGDHPANSATSTSVAFTSAIDQSDGLGGGGGCPADRTVSFGGVPLTLPWSQLCSPLALLGRVMVAVCMLAAVGIVFRG